MCPVMKEPSIRERMEMPERAHFRESLPGGRLAVPRAKKMVFPNVTTGLSILSLSATRCQGGGQPVCIPMKTLQAL